MIKQEKDRYTQMIRNTLRVLILCASTTLYGQGNVNFVSGQDVSQRPITTAVPFLNFAPDARSASMGDVGVATKPTVQSIHWNNAKLAFVQESSSFSFSYTPWLSRIVDDMYIAYLAAHTKLKGEQAIGFSFRYFNLGDVFLTNQAGASAGTFSPRDFAIDATYSRKISEKVGIGGTARLIQSNLSKSFETDIGGKSAGTLAVDLGIFYNNPTARFLGKDVLLSAGAHLSNIGGKITYGDNSENFIPSNLRVGTAITRFLANNQSLTFALDLNKLLVPTPPIYHLNDDGSLETDTEGNPVIANGSDPNRSSIGSIFSSFSDAPDGFSEELQEVTLSFGMEYWYKQLFSLQTGYFSEHEQKGNRKYFTLGAGFRYNVFGIDFAYLLPSTKDHPLAQTLRFSLYFTPSAAISQPRSDAPPTQSPSSSIQNDTY